MRLSWDTPDDDGGADIIRYEIRYFRLNFTAIVMPLGLGLETTVSNLTNGAEYYFMVSAVNSAGKGPSAVVRARPRTVPDAPENLTAKSRDGSVILNWDRPIDNGGVAVTGYRYRHAEGASVPAGTTWKSIGNNVEVTVTDLINGTEYAFEVRATNREGNGAIAEVTKTPATVPSAPQNLTATPGNGEVTLAWQAPEDNGGAELRRYVYRHAEGESVPAGKPWRSAGTNLTVTVDSLVNGAAYTFEVRAVNPRGRGHIAEIGAALATIPSAPQNLTAKPGDGKVTLAWQAPDDDGGAAVTGYRYRYAQGASVPENMAWTSAGANLTVTVNGLANGTAYTFEVLAVNQTGAGAAVEIAATPAAVSAAPQNLAATPGDRMVMLVWQAPNDDGGTPVTGYQYRYAEGASVPENKAWISAGADLTVTVGNLTNGIAHAFEVRAVRQRIGGDAAEVGATPATVPSAPQNLAATPGEDAVVLAWQAPGDDGGAAVTGYRYRYADGASVPENKVWISAGADLTVTVNGLTDGAAYAFEVRAANAMGEGPAARVRTTTADANADPTVANAIPNQSATTGARFHYVFPANTFSDADGDTLSYTATERDGRALPDWLTFTPSTRTFSGTPRDADLGRVRVKVTASDGNGGSVSDAFVIRVRPGTPGTLELSVEMVDDEVTEGEPVRYRIVMSKPTGWISVGLRYGYRGRFMYTMPTNSEGDMRSRNGRLYWEVERDTVDDGKVEADGTFTVTLLPGDGYRLGSPSSATVRILDNDVPDLVHAQVSVDDARVEEGPGAVLEFPVTLDRAHSETVTVDWETLDGSARAGEDYEAGSGTVTFHPGETSKTVRVRVLDDAHDEGAESMLLFLSNASEADIDGRGTVAVGTIVNADPMPQSWIARFGRTVADQVLGAVESRMRASRAPGTEVSLAGQQVGGAIAGDGVSASARGNPADRFGIATEPERRLGAEARTMTQRDFLLGSSFSFTGGTERDGTYALWGRGAVTRFDGRDGALSLDGDVTSSMLGADWSRDAVTAGLVVSHSVGEGGYRGESGSGEVRSSLTGLYPWGRYTLSERVSVWGVAGYGEGTLRLTPEGQAPISTDLDLAMAAAGLRGVLAQAPETGGFDLAVKTDAMGVRTSTAKAEGLAAAQAEVTRLRLGLEGSRPFRFEGGANLTPSVEIGLRHDGGDSDTGFGVDIGGGLAWSDPQHGLSVEFRGRGLLTHAADGFRERGLSGSLSWDPAPETARGPSLSLSQTLGAQASGGMDALLERGTLAGLAANDNGGFAQRRFGMKLGYGLPAFGGRFTGTPEIGFGFSGERREYSLGWRLTPEGQLGGAFDLSVEAKRQESANDNAEPVHEVGFRLTTRF